MEELTVGAYGEVLTLALGCASAGAVYSPSEVGVWVVGPTTQSLLKITQHRRRWRRGAGACRAREVGKERGKEKEREESIFYVKAGGKDLDNLMSLR